MVFRRTGSLSGQNVFPLATCWEAQPPIPDGFQLVSFLKEEKLSLQRPGLMGPLELFPLVADFFDLRFQLLFFREPLMPALPERGGFLSMLVIIDPTVCRILASDCKLLQFFRLALILFNGEGVSLYSPGTTGNGSVIFSLTSIALIATSPLRQTLWVQSCSGWARNL